MAPHFLGKHQRTVCSGCKFEVLSELAASSDNSVVCPNCGLACTAANTFVKEPADQLSLELGELPERWQVIGFQRSNDDQALIKRVIGLPGETIWFERGNVFLQTKGDAAELIKKELGTTKINSSTRARQSVSRRYSALVATAADESFDCNGASEISDC